MTKLGFGTTGFNSNGNNGVERVVEALNTYAEGIPNVDYYAFTNHAMAASPKARLAWTTARSLACSIDNAYDRKRVLRRHIYQLMKEKALA